MLEAAEERVLLAPQRRPLGFWRHSLVQLTLARYREFYREPEAMFWSLALPLILAAALGFAFQNRPAEVVRVGTTDRGIQASLLRDKAVSVELLTVAEAETRLRSGRLPLVVMRSADGSIQYKYDSSNAEARTARMMTDIAVQRAAGQTNLVTTSDVLVREPGSRYIDFVVPGLLGMNLMSSGIWGVGFAVVDARRRKLLKRFVATPMSRTYYLLSFLIARLTMLLVEVSVLAGFGVLVFGVPLRGSVVLLGLICLTGSLAFSGIGLLIASRIRTAEAASGLMNLTMLPMWMLSGVFFSSERFPDALQPVIQALPLTSLVDALRATMLEGASPLTVASDAGMLTAWAAAALVAALTLFRWK